MAPGRCRSGQWFLGATKFELPWYDRPAATTSPKGLMPIKVTTRETPTSDSLVAVQLDPAPAPFVLLCKWCVRIAPLTHADLTRYAREGWPHCCNYPMLCSTPNALGYKRYGGPSEWSVRLPARSVLSPAAPPNAAVTTSLLVVGPANACDRPTLAYCAEITWPDDVP